MRLGSYAGVTPIKITLKTQSATKILARTFRLKDCEEKKFVRKIILHQLKEKLEREMKF